MFDPENQAIFSDRPPPKVCFQVLINYNDQHEIVGKKVKKSARYLESQAIPTFSRAYTSAAETAMSIQKKFPDSQVAKLALDEAPDDYLFYVIDKGKTEIARVGVSVCDYRKAVIH